MKYDRDGLIKWVVGELNPCCPEHFEVEIECVDSCRDCWKQVLGQILIPSEGEAK